MAKMRLADPERNTGHFEPGCTVAGGPFYKEASEFYHDSPYARKEDLEPVEHPGFSRGVRWATPGKVEELRARPHSSRAGMNLSRTKNKRKSSNVY